MSEDANKTNMQLQMMKQIHALVEKMSYEESATKKAFATLYRELEQYKSEFVFKMEKGLLLDLLSFFDSLMWFQTVVKTTPEHTDENLKYLIDEFLEILRRRDVSPYPLAEKFDRKLHRILQVVPTEDQSQDGNIEAILRRGFFRGQHSLRDEEVSIYRFKQPVPKEPPAEDSDAEIPETAKEKQKSNAETSEEESSETSEEGNVETSEEANQETSEVANEEASTEKSSVEAIESPAMIKVEPQEPATKTDSSET